eukprot:NODE_812_length_1435_cov_99.235931_g672_i0.p1 GENE.NODE_812_length_1435_cov_99.235931_g672_i0~~NODE_812_length_1435_cov_99.235931_g672_i0.p1  ORF type:complete len:456 (+),score=150.85 NODE_812_length_1435_cov_99.235931_g672_i0:148-1368(+)
MYAFVGTTISTFIVGGLVYTAGYYGICHSLGGLASLVFGALISATDPVTVLAVFQRLGVDINLYSLVFGESVLNDAVAIVLCRTLLQFKCSPVTAWTVLVAFGSFVFVFLGSFVIGVLVAMVSSLIYKHARLSEKEAFVTNEVTFLVIFPYIAFLMAESMAMSGIVSILFCGMGMRHYTYWNLSHAARVSARGLFKVLSSLAETFVFVYLGLSMFTFPMTLQQIRLLLVALAAILLARVCNVVPGTWLVNRLRKKEHAIPPRFQFAVWFAGLRGAVAFVIAVTTWLEDEFENGDSTSLLTCTLCIAVITVLFMGGSSTYMIDRLQLRQPEGEAESYTRSNNRLVRFDKWYVRPFLTQKPSTAPSVPPAFPAWSPHGVNEPHPAVESEMPLVILEAVPRHPEGGWVD